MIRPCAGNLSYVGGRGAREEAGDDEAYELWTLWKAAHERVESAVVAAATAASDLTDTEIAVLVPLDEAGGRLRRAELGRLLGWERSRLLHQLSRMTTRGLLVCEGSGLQVDVAATPDALHRLGLAQPVHITEVQRRLVDQVPDPAALRAALEAVLSADRGSTPTAQTAPRESF